MQTKLQELTDKIYQEGVLKAESEAGEILDRARSEARQVVEHAQQEAESLLAQARKEADDMSRNSKNELQMAARQMVSDLKQQIAALVEGGVLKAPLAERFKSVEFVGDILISAVKNWNPASGEAVKLEVLLPEEKLVAIEGYLKQESASLLDGGLKLTGSDRVPSGFMIGPAEGGYRISFSDDDFAGFLKGYIRPRLMEMLFDDKGNAKA
jgi:V/A-type H+/Na+-transporting ATPase subunit E